MAAKLCRARLNFQPFPGQQGEGYFVVITGSNPVIRQSDETPRRFFSPVLFPFDQAMQQLAWSFIFAAVKTGVAAPAAVQFALRDFEMR